MILTNQNYLNYTREELNLLGFSNDDINSVVYGEAKFVIKSQSSLIWQDNTQLNKNGGQYGKR